MQKMKRRTVARGSLSGLQATYCQRSVDRFTVVSTNRLFNTISLSQQSFPPIEFCFVFFFFFYCRTYDLKLAKIAK